MIPITIACTINACLHRIFIYLGISLEVVPIDAACSIDEILLHISFLEAYGVQDAAKIKALKEKTNRQAVVIHSIQTKVKQI